MCTNVPPSLFWRCDKLRSLVSVPKSIFIWRQMSSGKWAIRVSWTFIEITQIYLALLLSWSMAVGVSPVYKWNLPLSLSHSPSLALFVLHSVRIQFNRLHTAQSIVNSKEKVDDGRRRFPNGIQTHAGYFIAKRALNASIISSHSKGRLFAMSIAGTLCTSFVKMGDKKQKYVTKV